VRSFLAVATLILIAGGAAAACGSSSSDVVADVTREPGLALVRIGSMQVQAEVPKDAAFYQGLGGRESLTDDRGMLFIFSQSGRHSFWMKDMLISIDIIWISAEGRVVDVQTAQPEPGVPDDQLKRYVPKDADLYVLEVRAGLADEKGVHVGDEAQIELP
jgi:uncharacterized membrane protein (UPF0127 family)